MNPYIELIEKRVPIIFDGAFGTQVQKSNIAVEYFQNASGCNEILNLTCPEKVAAIHADYLRAGANVIETNSFGGSRVKLKEYGLEDRVYEINKAAALTARKVVESSKSSNPLFVCGTIGPTGFLPSSKDKSLMGGGFDELCRIFEEQAIGLLDGGVDLFLIETSQDLLEVRSAIYALKRLMARKGRSIPIQVQITIDPTGRMLLGSGIESFLGAVIALSPSVIGLNCGTGPVEMLPSLNRLLELSTLPVSAIPNAGTPQNIDGKAVYGMEPKDFAAVLEPVVTVSGLEIVGGCCGTTPDHISALASALKGKKVALRPVRNSKTCWLSTGIGGVDLEKVNRPIIIGERLNTQGSRKTKELILASDYHELMHIAHEQSRSGSALLDICVAVSEQDTEAQTMQNFVSFLSDRIAIPLCIDSTEPEVMAAALKVNPGSVMFNSINLEHNKEKARNVLTLARDFGCPVVALTIDDEGMAKTVSRKVELAHRLHELVCGEYGIAEHYLYIDPLVFTLATGDPESADAALLSLEALRRIKKEMPGVRTVMGVSNVSFGLKPAARRILNNVMLYHAVNAGLDAAIFNPLHIDNPEDYDKAVRSCAEDLLFNRNADALSRFVQYFENQATGQAVKREIAADLPSESRLRNAVLNRDKRDLSGIITVLLKSMPAHDILNNILLPAMSEVGEKMSSGQMILPFVLQAAEIMKEAVQILEPHLLTGCTGARGKLVIATVFGDVHDIGKNLVGSILRNQGYEIIDLGKQVPLDVIIDAVKREKPDALGLSALLVTTSRQMAQCVIELDKQNINIPVLIGGAAVNKQFASRIAVLDNNRQYAGGVYYAKDAFEANKILQGICENKPEEKEKYASKIEKKSDNSDSGDDQLESLPHIEPPFWGTSEILVWDSASLLDKINKEKLFKAAWGGGKLKDNEYAHVRETQFEVAFESLREEILKADLLDARGFYGYFPVITDDEDVIIIDPADFHSELAGFRFPRMPKSKGRSIADYFSAEGDLIGIQIVTIGSGISERSREYFRQDKYSLGFFLNALGNILVEDLAEKVTVEIRRGLGLEPNTGRRYSFGYPGLPDLEEQKKIFEFMAIDDRLGVHLTSGFQMVPEHSTLGIFVHHPQAEFLI
jgi:5-methyltetrahydrofolate--homocysteine methyltransferase